MASHRSRGNPRLLSIGGNPYRVVVTENWREAAEWARDLLSLPQERTRAVGVSFVRIPRVTRGGSVIHRLYSLHLACSSRALVYRPTFCEEGTILPMGLLLILCNPSYFFIGENIFHAMELLRLRTSPPLAPTMDLRYAPGIFGLRLRDLCASRLPLNVAVAAALLANVDVRLLRTQVCRCRWTWPLNDHQLEEAVQTAAIPEMVGKLIIARVSAW